jgi:hypothetical protein
MTNYNEAVAEARQLIKRSEEDQWRLAELTWQTVEGGVSKSQWARDIGTGRIHVLALYRVWARWGERARTPDLTFTDVYAMAREQTDDPQEARQSADERRALSAVRKATPDRKAEFARELLSQPEVAERVVHDNIVRENVRRALDERYEQAPKPYSTRPAGIGNEPFELLSRFRKVHIEVDAIVQLILSGRAIVNDTERDALLKETEWLEAAAGTIKSGLSAGSLDQALRAFQEEWLS